MAEPGKREDASGEWDSIERELTDAAALVRERDSAAAVASRADEQVAAIERQLDGAMRSAGLEQEDVDQLTTVTARSILAVLKRSRGTELERERAELEAARGHVSELSARRMELVAARTEAYNRVSAYRDADGRLARALDAKERVLRDRPGSAGQRLGEIALETGRLAGEAKELREAIAAGRSAISAFGPLLSELGSAGSWADVDTFLGGGLIASAIKHDHMDAAADLSRQVDSALAAFRRDPGDVRIDAVTEALDLSPGTRFVDSWFDNIFTDLSVRSRIGDARAQAEQLCATVSAAVDACSVRLQDTTARQSGLESQRQALLRSSLENPGTSVSSG